LKPRVHFFGGQGIGWALDEDLDRARAALGDQVVAGRFASSRIVHSAWWPPLLRIGTRALSGKSVVCFADNPPAFYLTRPGFERAAARVDLWIARSREALDQFRQLGLPAALAPYTVDPGVFHPLPDSERMKVRASLGFAPGDFVVGNFHRDSLERDVSLPKAQKGPDQFLDVVTEAARTIPNLKVLLAGPRRHWLRRMLDQKNIPFAFSGTILEGDDFSCNVLPRDALNRLYSALDAVVISSRWEGGPYSVLEGLFAGRPVVSTQVGMARDLLDGWLYSSPAEGASLLAAINREHPDFSGLRGRALASHSADALASALLDAYAKFPDGRESRARMVAGFFHAGLARVFPRSAELRSVHPGVAAAMSAVREKKSGGQRVVDEAIAIADAEASHA
jgi:glycosyltransferase involved in cell wall biosynthesis